MDYEQEMIKAVREGLREGIKAKLTSPYANNPVEKIISEMMNKHENSFRKLLDESLVSAIGDEEFRTQIKQSVRHSLAKTLIAKFGGELEKQVNVLKSDPLTRAKITLAIEEIVKSKTN